MTETSCTSWMMNAGVAAALATLSLCSGCNMPSTLDNGSEAPVLPIATSSEKGFREQVRRSEKPVYPRGPLEESIGGVVVAEVEVSSDGSPKRVDILEAPDPRIAESVSAALARWEFSLLEFEGKETPRRPQGRLTFYFVPGDGGQVLNPEEMLAAQNVSDRGDVSPENVSITKIDEKGLARLLSTDDPLIVDIRDRRQYQLGHRDGAINIPFGELPSRARVELPPSRLIVVECASVPSNWCQGIGWQLADQGFSRLALLVEQ